MKKKSKTRMKRNFENRFANMIFLILISFIPFLFLPSLIPLFLYFSLFIITIGISLFFWKRFIPYYPRGLDKSLQLLKSIFVASRLKYRTCFYIQNGIFDSDYFNIRIKPRIFALLIDERSAAVAIDHSGQKRVFLNGFHLIKKDETILHVFSLDAQYISWGPIEDKDPSSRFTDTTSSVGYYVESLESQQTNYTTKDCATIIPTFSIYFQIKALIEGEHLKKNLRILSDFFSDRNVKGELNQHIENCIGDIVSSKFEDFAGDLNSSELIQPSGERAVLTDEFISKVNNSINNNDSSFPGKQLTVKVYLNKILVLSKSHQAKADE